MSQAKKMLMPCRRTMVDGGEKEGAATARHYSFHGSRIGTRSMNFQSLLVVSLVAMELCLGCSSPDPANLLAEANNSNIQRLANLYEAYQSRHNWRGPKDEAEFKSFLKGWNPKKLTNVGVDPNAIDDVFVSDRDGEPFQVRYGVPGHIMGSDAPVVFETTGIDGKRMVGFLNMTSREVDEAEYNDLWEGKATPQQSSRHGS